MRELLWQIEELNRQQDTWDVIGYVDISDAHGTICVGDREYPYLGNDDFLLNKTEVANVAICVGDPALREKIAK